ncbi:hypothetical protein FA15DRAFT_660316 [Coprinopsis marcescibilis]|uniref:Uncharacterized protein n=1 Tax=Coprinopsis marcescibilis TaxID=230819 RepID=A0A5C3KT28_COPMA|nr:hypothetical protein FA15DRAFT_660316 [Coprinopsis marcescibilis]
MCQDEGADPRTNGSWFSNQIIVFGQKLYRALDPVEAASRKKRGSASLRAAKDTVYGKVRSPCQHEETCKTSSLFGTLSDRMAGMGGQNDDKIGAMYQDSDICALLHRREPFVPEIKIKRFGDATMHLATKGRCGARGITQIRLHSENEVEAREHKWSESSTADRNLILSGCCPANRSREGRLQVMPRSRWHASFTVTSSTATNKALGDWSRVADRTQRGLQCARIVPEYMAYGMAGSQGFQATYLVLDASDERFRSEIAFGIW